MPPADIDLTVYPDECDAFGHLNQASFLALFERARWETVAHGPGMDVFTRHAAWPAVRKASVEYLAAAFPGDVLRFHLTLVHHGRTSFTLRQSARRLRDDVLIASAEFLFVCIDASGRPTPVPAEFTSFVNARTPGGDQRLTVNGVSLAVDLRGGGPAVLFIHGYPLDHSIWLPQLDALDGWRRIAPDLRGMGSSDAPDLGYGIATYADDLVALLDALGVDRAVLCGHSMGGYIAFEVLRRYRTRVSGLILVATRAEPDTPEGLKAREAAAQQARELGAAAIADTMLPNMLAPDSRQENPGLAERVHQLMARTPVSGIVGALAAMRERSDSTPLLATLERLPTLVLAGGDDRLIPVERVRAMADRIPGARFTVIPGAAHLPMLESPQPTSSAIRAFLASLG
ncbi:MAG TPA: alpha/beta fold hydrolase [Gemmatimonadales bacterium]|nr:alpha/beta fold hydrolase [Gemmatimonadales bacterium]